MVVQGSSSLEVNVDAVAGRVGWVGWDEPESGCEETVKMIPENRG